MSNPPPLYALYLATSPDSEDLTEWCRQIRKLDERDRQDLFDMLRQQDPLINALVLDLVEAFGLAEGDRVSTPNEHDFVVAKYLAGRGWRR